MKADGSSPRTLLRFGISGHLGGVGLAALLLASCSTSTDPFAQLGLVTQPANPQYALTQTDKRLSETDGGMYSVVSEDDPDLPNEVASQPSLANGDDPVAYAADDSVQGATVEVAAAGAPQVDDPVLAARMGADGVYLESAPERQQVAAAAAPQPPKKRSFFASLFAEPKPEQPVARQAPPVQPEVNTDPEAQQAATASETEATDPGEVVVASAEPTPSTGSAQPEPTAFIENRPPEAVPPPAPRKRGFLSAFFSKSDPEPRTQPQRQRPVVKLASAAPATASAANIYANDALPGVRDQDTLYDIKRKSGSDDVSDIDINEGDGVQLAMAPGLARLAPNGLLVQTDRVDIACLKPSLVRVLKAVERHYGERVVVTSGYRSPPHNRRARGARNSLHMYCAAADIQVANVSKWELAQYLRSMPGRGGVGTYCHTKSVHIDVGPERDWNWRCRRRRK